MQEPEVSSLGYKACFTTMVSYYHKTFWIGIEVLNLSPLIYNIENMGKKIVGELRHIITHHSNTISILRTIKGRTN